MKSFIALLVFFGASSVFAGNVVCKGQSSSTGLPIRVEIAEDTVILSGGNLHRPRVISNLTKVNGLITARGLAITMQNHFGCLRNAVIITEFTELIGAGYMDVVNVDTCSGGTTSDETCDVSAN
ncbi:hypothetical protein D3C87_1380820 [compost metagenome]